MDAVLLPALKYYLNRTDDTSSWSLTVMDTIQKSHFLHNRLGAAEIQEISRALDANSKSNTNDANIDKIMERIPSDIATLIWSAVQDAFWIRMMTRHGKPKQAHACIHPNVLTLALGFVRADVPRVEDYAFRWLVRTIKQTPYAPQVLNSETEQRLRVIAHVYATSKPEKQTDAPTPAELVDRAMLENFRRDVLKPAVKDVTDQAVHRAFRTATPYIVSIMLLTAGLCMQCVDASVQPGTHVYHTFRFATRHPRRAGHVPGAPPYDGAYCYMMLHDGCMATAVGSVPSNKTTLQSDYPCPLCCFAALCAVPEKGLSMTP
eukprot:2203263-Rhodomonas_salina.1